MLERVYFATATTGTSDIVVGAAMSGYATPTQAGAVNARLYGYHIVDGANMATGIGTWTSSTSTLVRDSAEVRVVGGTQSTAKLSLSGGARVILSPTVSQWDALNRFNVRDFGAKGDGVTDDSAAIRNALRALQTRCSLFTGYYQGTGQLYFPEGVYRIVDSGVLSAFDSSPRKRSSATLKGAGPRNTILWLDPAGAAADKWFYDNGATETQWGMTFEDMCFSSGTTWQHGNPSTGSTTGYTLDNINAYGNGFKLTGPGWESAFVFNRVEFRYLQTVFHCAGSNNVDTHRFIATDVLKCNNIIYIDNQQSLGIRWIGGYLDGVYGNVLEYGSNSVGGGGDFSMTDATIIALAGTGDTDVHHVVKATAGGPVVGNGAIAFDKVRLELRGNYHGLVNITEGNGCAAFRSCSVLGTGTADKNLVTVGGYASVLFDNTNVTAGTGGGRFKYIVGGAGDGLRGKNASLSFINKSQINASIVSTDLTFAGNGGRFSIDETCVDTVTNVAPASDPKTSSMACTIFGVPSTTTGGGLAVSATHRARRRYTISPFVSAAQLVGASGLTGISTQVPLYSRLVEAWVRIEAGQGNGNNIRCLIGNDDKTVTYGSTTVGAQNAGQYLKVDLQQILADTTNVRRVRFWFDDGAGGNTSASSSGRVDGGVVWE